ncbi:50S ribosomal protein L4 [Buchnera aphidicola (Neophyllaphis podocarpi)]|uniref:50S ribosomal protein L4 n=1 Tax=Buchnera aphidicola TaxID=9 RepID=UPI0031B88C32
MELELCDSKELIHISSDIFTYEYNKSLIHQITVAYRAKSRQGSKAQKNRAEVKGSGRKPWRQKGTGRARAGSFSSPIWRSGGVTFAAKPRNYSQKVNKKMYKSSLKSIFSELLRENRLLIFNDFKIDYPKTKLLLEKVKKISFNKILIITHKYDKNIFLASRNLYNINICQVTSINPLMLISCKKIIITVEALRNLEEILE